VSTSDGAEVETYLAVEGTSIRDIFLGLVWVHYLLSASFYGLKRVGTHTSEAFCNLCDSVLISTLQPDRWDGESEYLSGLKVPSVSAQNGAVSREGAATCSRKRIPMYATLPLAPPISYPCQWLVQMYLRVHTSGICFSISYEPLERRHPTHLSNDRHRVSKLGLPTSCSISGFESTDQH